MNNVTRLLTSNSVLAEIHFSKLTKTVWRKRHNQALESIKHRTGGEKGNLLLQNYVNESGEPCTPLPERRAAKVRVDAG